MKKVLIVFWHGLGDNISVTPALRKYKQITGNYIGWAMLKRFKPAHLMDKCPYIDKIHWISDAWNDFSGYKEGIKEIQKEAETIAEEHGYDEVKMIPFNGNGVHRIFRGARDIGVTLEPNEVHTEWWYEPSEMIPFYQKINLPKKFVFFHGIAGAPSKSWPREIAIKRIEKDFPGMPIISPDFTWDYKQFPIAFAVDVMKRATHRYIVDSSLYYIAHALDIPMDLVYFKRGPVVYTDNCSLHGSSERITYTP